MPNGAQVMIYNGKGDAVLGDSWQHPALWSNPLHHVQASSASSDKLCHSESGAPERQSSTSHTVGNRTDGSDRKGIDRNVWRHGTSSVLHTRCVVLKISKSKKFHHVSNPFINSEELQNSALHMPNLINPRQWLERILNQVHRTIFLYSSALSLESTVIGRAPWILKGLIRAVCALLIATRLAMVIGWLWQGRCLWLIVRRRFEKPNKTAAAEGFWNREWNNRESIH